MALLEYFFDDFLYFIFTLFFKKLRNKNYSKQVLFKTENWRTGTRATAMNVLDELRRYVEMNLADEVEMNLAWAPASHHTYGDKAVELFRSLSPEVFKEYTVRQDRKRSFLVAGSCYRKDQYFFHKRDWEAKRCGTQAFLSNP